MTESEMLAWVPSMRALNESTSYEHYLELMKKYEDEINAKIDDAFQRS